MSIFYMDRNIITSTKQEDLSGETLDEVTHENEFEDDAYDLGESKFLMATRSEEISYL